MSGTIFGNNSCDKHIHIISTGETESIKRFENLILADSDWQEITALAKEIDTIPPNELLS